LGQIGLEPDRIRMFQMSSAMAGAFASAAQEMSEQIHSLGPNPLKQTASPVEMEISQESGLRKDSTN